MPKYLTEDQVRDLAREKLNLKDIKHAEAGVGQLTTFNQLGFKGVADKPDGWYLPACVAEPAMILETKSSRTTLGEKPAEELLKNIKIAETKYQKVVGILYNGNSVRVFLSNQEIETPDELQPLDYYLNLFTRSGVDKEKIYEITQRVNNCLHSEFGIKNLYHRMIFTACALVAKRYGAFMERGMDYTEFHTAILNALNKALIRDKQQNLKLGLLPEVYSEIKMNLNVDTEDDKGQDHVKALIGDFIDWVTEISDCLNSNEWNGEDVMGIFFNEFNRYKKKSEQGQIFTPDHITDFMYHLIDCNKDDYILDATCGSGAFLVKAMSNMIKEAGGVDTKKAKQIKQKQLFGIEFDREIFALACANMLIHKDGKTNLAQLDTRTEKACEWIKEKPITKALHNPPFENKHGCMQIVENVLDSVKPRTECAFILPDKKLEKTSKKQIDRILSNHRLTKIIKMPEDLFFGVGVTTSIFVFEAGVPQNNQEIFSCYIEKDGLETVKNKGRHDIKNKWPEIQRYWLDSIKKYRDEKYHTDQWLKPSEHLSYQMPEKPFEVTDENFSETGMQSSCFKQTIDIKTLSEKLLDLALYNSKVSEDDKTIKIEIKKES